MEVLTMTPFGRQPVTTGLMQQLSDTRAAPKLPTANKWTLLRNLTTAAEAFGLNRSALVVLQALLSFHKSAELGNDPLVVFPSNRTLATRAHGMPESTLRRNIALLVKAGLIARHDSPNGKRYAVRREGEIARAFGFDLSPLLRHAQDIENAAQSVEAHNVEIAELREKAMLLKRDAWKLLDFAKAEGISGPWDALEAALNAAQARLRRKLGITALNTLCAALSSSVDKLSDILAPTPTKTPEMSACDDQNERHIQNSNKYKLESEQSKETDQTLPSNLPATVPIAVIRQACPDIMPYAGGEIRQNYDLVETAHHLHPMMGITGEVWQRAMRIMGAEQAAVTLACILQRIDTIRNPGGYLRRLTQRAEEGKFHVWPMVKALLADGSERAGGMA